MIFFIVTAIVMTVAILVVYKIARKLELALSLPALVCCGICALLINFLSIPMTPFLTEYRFVVLGAMVIGAAVVITSVNYFLIRKRLKKKVPSQDENLQPEPVAIEDELVPVVNSAILSDEQVAAIISDEPEPTVEAEPMAAPAIPEPEPEPEPILEPEMVAEPEPIVEAEPEPMAEIPEATPEEVIPEEAEIEAEPEIAEATEEEIPEEAEGETEPEFAEATEEEAPEEAEGETEPEFAEATEEEAPEEAEGEAESEIAGATEEEIPEEAEVEAEPEIAEATEEEIPEEAEVEAEPEIAEATEEEIPEEAEVETEPEIAEATEEEAPQEAEVETEPEFTEATEEGIPEEAEIEAEPEIAAEPAVEEKLDQTNNLDDILDYAFELKGSSNWAGALKAYTYALEQYRNDSYSPFLVLEIVNIHKDHGHYDDAIQCFYEALDIPAVADSPDMLAEFEDSMIYLEATKEVLKDENHPDMPFFDIPQEYMSKIESIYNERKARSI